MICEEAHISSCSGHAHTTVNVMSREWPHGSKHVTRHPVFVPRLCVIYFRKINATCTHLIMSTQQSSTKLSTLSQKRQQTIIHNLNLSTFTCLAFLCVYTAQTELCSYEEYRTNTSYIRSYLVWQSGRISFQKVCFFTLKMFPH